MYYAPAQTYLGTFESIKSVMFVLQIKKKRNMYRCDYQWS